MFSPAGAGQMFGNDQFQQMGMAMGQQVLGQNVDLLKSKAQEYIPTTRLRYLFAVDNGYVFNKLKIILLPWFQNEWHLKYQTDQNNPIAPRYVATNPISPREAYKSRLNNIKLFFKVMM